jgi:hypothetical protein
MITALKMFRIESDHAKNPKKLSNSPGVIRRKTKISSSAVMK